MLTLHRRDQIVVVCSFCHAEHELPAPSVPTAAEQEAHIIASARAASWVVEERTSEEEEWGDIACPRCTRHVLHGVPAHAENVQRWLARVVSVEGRRGHRVLQLTLWADNANAAQAMRGACVDWKPKRADGDLYASITEAFGVATFRGRIAVGSSVSVVTFVHFGRDRAIVKDVTARRERGTR